MGYVVHTVSDRRTLRDFIDLPWRVYRDDPNWVPPISSEVRRTLDERRNPFFARARRRLYVCYHDGSAVARIAVVINPRHQEKFGVKSAFFGFFESMNDPEAVRQMFTTAVEYCRQEGVELLEGPFNPNHYSELGLQVSNFDTPPTFFQTYNPGYYCGLLEGIGFRKSACFYTARNDQIREYVVNRYGDMQSPLELQGFTVRSLDLARLATDLEILREVFNDAFSSNWHFLSVSKEEYQFSAKFLRLVTDPDLVVIVEHDGKAVGVLLCVLDINPLLKKLRGKVGPIKYIRFLRERKRIRRLIVYAVGIRKAYRGTEVFRLLLRTMCRIALRYDALETTWMSDNNGSAVRAADHLGLEPDKQFAIYEMALKS